MNETFDTFEHPSAGYRGWSAELRPIWTTIWPIARTSMLVVFRRKLFWILLAIASFDFLLLFASIYLSAQIQREDPFLGGMASRVMARSATGTGMMYLNFMLAQGTVTMLMLGFAGSQMIGVDFAQAGLAFYLSRRLGKPHYMLGKMLAVGLLVSLTATVPALILFLEYGLLSDSWSYFSDNVRLPFAILGYGILMSVALSLLVLALSCWLERTVPIVISCACVFVFLPAIGILLRDVFDDRSWLLLSLWRDIWLVGAWCFGSMRDSEEPFRWVALAIVMAVSLVCAAVTLPRIHAVRVVE